MSRTRYIEKYNIAVLMGGFSSEREISLKSGKAVAHALGSVGHKVIEIDVRDEKLAELLGLPEKPDCVFIALHGKFGEDGQVQSVLDEKGYVYTGSGRVACQNAMDKLASKQIFRRRGISIPAYKMVKKETTLDEYKKLAGDLGYPVVVKPRAEGSSVGVTVVKNETTLENAIAEAYKFGSDAVLEKFIAGREMTVGILDGQPMAVIEIKPKREFFDWQAKYEDALTQYIVDPEDLSQPEKAKLQDIALQSHQVLGCEGFSRVDMIYSRMKNIYVLEVNAIPGLTERSLLPKAASWQGISFVSLCNRIVRSALNKKKLPKSG